jgi:hypothetical protein
MPNARKRAIVMLIMSPSLVSADACVMNYSPDGVIPSFSSCLDTAGTYHYCPAMCGEYAPLTLDCAKDCDPTMTFTSYDGGICVKDEGSSTYPHCQNDFANEWGPSPSPFCELGKTTCTVDGRYYCHGHEIIVEPNLPIGIGMSYTVGPTPLEFQITYDQTDPTVSINPSCTLTKISPSCRVYEKLTPTTDIRARPGTEFTDTNIIAMTSDATGWKMTLPLTTATAMTNVLTVLCGDSYGWFAHFRATSNEFSFEVQCINMPCVTFAAALDSG